MWKLYFNFIKLKPGRVITSQGGDIDFRSDNISIETIKKLYESNFPYLEITELGKKELYGIDPVTENTAVTEKPKTVRKRKITA
jgi:hypothetical protein